MENKYEKMLQQHIQWNRSYRNFRSIYLNRVVNGMTTVTLVALAIFVFLTKYGSTGFVLLDMMIGSIFCMLCMSFLTLFPALALGSIEKAAEVADSEVYGNAYQ